MSKRLTYKEIVEAGKRYQEGISSGKSITAIASAEGVTYRTVRRRINAYHDSLKKKEAPTSLVKIQRAALPLEEKIVIEFKGSKIYANASNIASVIKAISEC